MRTLSYETLLAAPPDTVWQRMLLSDAGYRDWTSAFMEGSYYEGSWDEGASIRFLSPAGDGLHARVRVSQRPHEVCLQHLNEIQGGQDRPPAEWAGAEERYRFSATPGGGTRLQVSVQVAEAYADMMDTMWQAALQRLQRLCAAAAP